METREVYVKVPVSERLHEKEKFEAWMSDNADIATDIGDDVYYLVHDIEHAERTFRINDLYDIYRPKPAFNHNSIDFDWSEKQEAERASVDVKKWESLKKEILDSFE